MNEVDDSQVATDFKNGDLKSFELIFNMLFPKIHGFSQSLLGPDQAVAEEIAMDSFAKLFQKCQHFDNLPNIRAFLYVATRNACLDYLRHSMRQDNLWRQWVNTVDRQSFIEIRQVEGEMFDAVKKAIDQLPKKCREVIRMIYFEGLGTAEIADRLSISIPTVRSQKRHGIHLLKAAFADKQMMVLGLLLVICYFPVVGFSSSWLQYGLLLFIQGLIIYRFLVVFFARS